jgi:hypothetical protein
LLYLAFIGSEKVEEQLKKKEEKLKDKKDDLDISERELQQVTAEADKQRAAYQDEIIRNEGMAEDKKKEFYELPKLEKFKRFSQPFGNG